MKVVLVTGARTLIINTGQRQELDRVNPDIVIHGGAKGADTLADRWCRDHGKVAQIHYPDYERYNKRTAPLIRNGDMVKELVRYRKEGHETHVIASPELLRSGTMHTVRLAEECGFKVIFVTEDPRK